MNVRLACPVVLAVPIGLANLVTKNLLGRVIVLENWINDFFEKRRVFGRF